MEEVSILGQKRIKWIYLCGNDMPFDSLYVENKKQKITDTFLLTDFMYNLFCQNSKKWRKYKRKDAKGRYVLENVPHRELFRCIKISLSNFSTFSSSII